ncbi:cbb3-type cytochrome c oxidase subunit I [Rhodopila globiformis]|uniref:Nitric-oxide reductase large subunit n=1 Tax=Rhodopila globiformis TaxID=1071 RepID=A0A2S6NN33_RHOGL|nr:cbb3-type cytochrome c oxidase subunit I [Rhodopila globiformis]PPQ38158.1 nitric-oxide reductase large subunit [Rhodopila globiformis]
MKYQSQQVARLYFLGALTIFCLQLVFGLTAATMYIWPTAIPTTLLPFSVARMIHTNALIVWLLMGFFGATYFLIPDEAERELYSPFLAKLQFWVFFGAAVVTVVGYLFGNYDGRSYLEQPIYIKVGIVVVALMFLFNVSMTVLKGRRTAISGILLMGLWGIAVFFLFAFYVPANIVIDKMFWWWVVHLWVEGVWELVMASILAYLMIKLTGVDREVVEKWLYVIVGTALFSGILGTGHHYYWIGTPAYWQWVGNIFSSLEPLPFFAMVLFCFGMVYKGGRDHPNKAALLWSLGCAVMAFFGAGVWGFLHTLSFVNYYTHGTQMTAAHGHLAFYGAYAMVNLAMITYATPLLAGREPYNQLLNMISFWTMNLGVVLMTVCLTFAGVLQTHLERVQGNDYMSVQQQLGLFYDGRLLGGVMTAVGLALYLTSLLWLPRRAAVPAAALSPAE